MKLFNSQNTGNKESFAGIRGKIEKIRATTVVLLGRTAAKAEVAERPIASVAAEDIGKMTMRELFAYDQEAKFDKGLTTKSSVDYAWRLASEGHPKDPSRREEPAAGNYFQVNTSDTSHLLGSRKPTQTQYREQYGQEPSVFTQNTEVAPAVLSNDGPVYGYESGYVVDAGEATLAAVGESGSAMGDYSYPPVQPMVLPPGGVIPN